MQPAATGSYRELRGIIRQAGLLEKQPRFYAAHLGGTLALIAAAVVALVLIGDSCWNLALAPAFAIISSQLAVVGLAFIGAGARLAPTTAPGQSPVDQPLTPAAPPPPIRATDH